MNEGAEVARLFARDASLWTSSGEDEWLGWIDAVDEAQRGLPELQAWAGPLGARHERVVLCGMGGSSLAPLVIGELTDCDRLHVLDSTDPDAVRAVPVEGSLFVIASKSGSTIEPNCFADAFWAKTGGDGSRFVAITDPGSALEERARRDGWARIAHGRPDVGGRYSALTAFGLVPGGARGHRRRADARRAPSPTLAKCHDELRRQPGPDARARDRQRAREGARQADVRDAAALASVGLWLEQLIAESTGKQGTGVLPVAGEPLGDAAPYGDDRLFIHLRQGPASDEQDAGARRLRAAGQPVFTVQLTATRPSSGALFVEWEIATALVGARLHINPFDQPNVQEAKDRTVAILEGFARDGKLPVEEPGSLSDVLAHAERGPLLRLPAGVRGPHARAPGAARAPAGPPARWARLRGHGRLRPALPPLHGPVPQGRAADRGVRAAAGGRAGRRGDPRARVRLPHAARRAGARRRGRAARPRPAGGAHSQWPPARRRSSERSSTSRTLRIST